MIQLNSVTPFGKMQSGEVSMAATDAQLSSSFQSQLEAALNATLQKFGVDPSKVNITIGPAASGSTQPQNTAANFAAGNIPAGNTPAAATTISSNTPAQDPIQAILAFDDAYWAKQPPAVQALRNIDDPAQRSLMAGQLSAAGYQIDAPIMVWGWDPSKITDARRGFGYTWVPSGMQNNVTLAPGLSVPGLPPYDPNNPPPDSIIV